MEVPILIVLIILSFIFSMSESAILGMNQLKLRLLKNKNDKRALRISRLLENKDRLINSLLVSNELVNIFISAIITSLSMKKFGSGGVGIATAIATVLLLIFGEITPKNISTRCPDKLAYAFSWLISITTIITKPLVMLLTAISRGVLRLFGIKLDDNKKSYTEEEIKTYFDMSSESGVIEEDENRMISQVFKFSDLEAQDIMVPRTKIRALPDTATYRDVIEFSQRLGFTRFPIYKKSIDDIIGIIYLKDLLAFKNCPEKFNIKKVARHPIFILGNQKMSAVQKILFENRQSMAIVVDEYSGTDGIVTQKDISREIFALPGDDSLRGKVFDYDSIENKNDFEINGSVLIRDIQKSLHIPLESKMNETIGGWFIEQLNRMPVVNDTLLHEGYLFTIIKIQRNRIERMRIENVSE